jgi:hypothetical protein
MNTAHALLTEIRQAAQTLLNEELLPQQRTFIQHIAQTAAKLAGMTADIPADEWTMRQILPLLGKEFTEPQAALFGYAKLLTDNPRLFGDQVPTPTQTALLQQIYTWGSALLQLTEATTAAAHTERMQQRHAGIATVALAPLLEQHAAVVRYWLRTALVTLKLDLPAALPAVKIQPYHFGALLQHVSLTYARELVRNGQLIWRTKTTQVFEMGIFCKGIVLVPHQMETLFGERHGRHIYLHYLAQQGGSLRLEREPSRGTSLWFTLPTE